MSLVNINSQYWFVLLVSSYPAYFCQYVWLLAVMIYPGSANCRSSSSATVTKQPFSIFLPHRLWASGVVCHCLLFVSWHVFAGSWACINLYVPYWQYELMHFFYCSIYCCKFAIRCNIFGCSIEIYLIEVFRSAQSYITVEIWSFHEI